MSLSEILIVFELRATLSYFKIDLNNAMSPFVLTSFIILSATLNAFVSIIDLLKKDFIDDDFFSLSNSTIFKFVLFIIFTFIQYYSNIE